MSKKQLLWLVDNGHGAKDLTKGKYSPVVDKLGIDDPTIYNHRFREGNFNRLVARNLCKQAIAAGLKAELLVPEDADISLAERVRRANARCAIYGTQNVVVLSIHGNAAGHGDQWKSANFWSVWTTKGKTKSDTIATCIWEACKEVMPDRRFGKQMQDGDVDYEEQFYILRKTACPAVLTENFFFDNEENLRFMASPEGRAKIVRGHLQGMIKYQALRG